MAGFSSECRPASRRNGVRLQIGISVRHRRYPQVFQLLRYDNLKSAVSKILRGHRREETAKFVAFRSHWRFAAEFCTPGEGHKKAAVIVTTNLPFSEWPQVIPNARLCKALIDRLTDRAYIITTGANS